MPFREEILRASLNSHLEGLNTDYINIDIILNKVQQGLYNGKYGAMALLTFRRYAGSFIRK